MTIPMTRGLVKPAKRAAAMRTAESAGVALWRRVADQLERAIADGRYPVDTRLPGEIGIARRLALAPRTAVIRLDILRSVDRVPVSAATTWLPADRAADAGRIYRQTRSLTRTLARIGIADFRRQSTWISAAIAEAADAARLRLAPGRPLIVVDSTDV